MRDHSTMHFFSIASIAFAVTALATAPSSPGPSGEPTSHVREWRASQTTARRRGRLLINVSGLKGGNGAMLVGLYDSRTEFPARGKQLTDRMIRVSGATAAVAFADVPHGRYAVAVIHDRNGNGKLDTRLGLLPTEPVGFSNGAKVRFGPPQFRDAAFDLATPDKAIAITVS